MYRAGYTAGVSTTSTPLFRKTAAGFYVAHNATITGDVTIGPQSSFWFNTVVRGDVAPVTIGARVNAQDAVVIHCDNGIPNVIEDDVSIGHGAIVHGKFVGRGTLIGMAATLLSRTQVGRGCLVGAGAVLPPGMIVPDRSVVMGVPGKVVRQVTEKDLEYLRWLPGQYIGLSERYLRGEVIELSRQP
jgi:carbonic anhydrase/acetyltransferase-like protein (isoleucine patch superfamily)